MRTAILNGFGRSLGDSIIGLQALHAAQSHAGFPRPVLIRQDFRRPMLTQIYALASDLADLVVAEDEAAAAVGFDPVIDRVIDLRDFAFDPGFRGVAMIDFFLARLGLDPAAVPPALRRNSWLATRLAPVRPAGLPERYVLVCPRASMPLRDMPDAVHQALLHALRHRPVVTQGAAHAGAVAVADCDRLDALCGLVAHAACVISTDTAMVHLADAFAVPCLAVFTTHRPEWRVRDYPLCRALHLAVAGLPEALEFSRSAQDEALVGGAWRDGAMRLLAAADAFLRAI